MKPESHPANLDLLIDGEGSPADLAMIEAHLTSCAVCRAAIAEKRMLSGIVRNHASHFKAPRASLERWQAIASISGAAREETGEIVQLRAPSGRKGAPPRWLGLAASLGFVAILSAGLMHLVDEQARNETVLADQTISSHIRSLLPNHLYDVESSDRHTVKPWFAGRINFSPPVKDLADQGFPLVGGRVDYLGRQQVAALVYRDRQHVINLFVWPSPATPGAVAVGPVEQGYNTLHWSKDDMAFWAVSDVNLADLQSFAEHFRD
jgi:anti-sigma factor RsiW